MTSVSKAQKFRSLHVAGQPLVLINAWDAGSARAVVESGVPAVATSSSAVAAAQGHKDGEHLPLAECLRNLQQIVQAVEVPVTIDLESGYSAQPEGVGETLQQAVRLGAVGCNLEDRAPGALVLRSVEEQVARLRVAKQAASALNPSFFLNVRTDVFYGQLAPRPDPERIADVVARARAYKEAGADGLFVPFTTDAAVIRQIVEQVELPVNIMLLDLGADLGPYRAAGVSRISFGPAPYLTVMAALKEKIARLSRG